MSAYNEQDIDFVKRTLDIIRQYESSSDNSKASEKYEYTLLINCLLGLLIVPQQQIYKDLPNTHLDSEKWGIESNDITVCQGGKTIQHIARHIRNSISHYNFKVISENAILSKIEFKDFNVRTNQVTFMAIVKLSSLKKFVENLSKLYITIMESSLGINASV